MLNKFEKEYLDLNLAYQQQQWENYFEDKQHDLTVLDSKIYELALICKGKIHGFDRKSEIARRIITRNLVDKHPEVAKLRNYIDDLDNYSRQLPSKLQEDGASFRAELARLMEPDVLRLLKLREAIARECAQMPYVDLVLASEGLEGEAVSKLLEDYLEENLVQSKALIAEYGLTMSNWFESIATIGTLTHSHDPQELIFRLLQALDYEELLEKIEIKYIKSGWAGYTAEVQPAKIKIALGTTATLNGLRTLFHELGHAVLYGLNREEGLLRVLPASLDESMAVVFEYLAPGLVLSEEETRGIHQQMTLEYTRCAISALFEFELWNNPDKAEELYEKHYGRLGIPILEPHLWALDSFRSIDPVYIQNYVLGAVLSKKIAVELQELAADDYKMWGKWLREHIYSKKAATFER